MLPPSLVNPATWALTQERVLVWMLVLTRLSGFLGVFPGFVESRMPAQVRLALGVLLTTVLAPLVPKPTVPMDSIPAMVWVMALELGVGLLLGTLVAWIMEAIAFGGQLMDTQMGFSFVQLVDPTNAQPSSVSSQLLGQVAILLLFATGLHHTMIFAFVDSYRLVPPGHFPVVQPLAMVGLLSQFLLRGLMLAFPVLAVLFLVDLILGLSGKFMPQLQLLQLGFPLKIGIGLLLLGLALRQLGPWMVPLMEAAVRHLPRLVGV
jgi:flagellar biosynthetic protein FliR